MWRRLSQSVSQSAPSARGRPIPDHNMEHRVLLVCLALVVSVWAATGDHENSVSIDQLSRQIRDVTSRDVQDNRKLIQDVIDTGHNETAKVYKYIDEAIKQLADNLIESIREMKNNTQENFATVEKNIKTNLEKMNSNMKTNNQLIVEGLAEGNRSSLSLLEDWVKERTISLEKIVSSRLSVCVHKREHQLPGTVTFDNFIHSKSDPKIINISGKDIEVRPPLCNCFLLLFFFV